MYRIGIDVGGTFTDLVAIDVAGATTLAKVPSTPDDPSLGVLDGLEQLAARLGLDRAALLSQTDRIVHICVDDVVLGEQLLVAGQCKHQHEDNDQRRQRHHSNP